MKNYLVISEDGTLMHTKELNGDLKDAFIKGYCDIIDITDPNKPLEPLEISFKKVFDDGEWSQISNMT